MKIKNKNLSRKLFCSVFNHDWKYHGTHLYCIDKYPKFVKLWQDYYSCNFCKTRIVPKWFNKNWRVKNQFAIFCEEDLSANFNKEEIKEYKKTAMILKSLNKRLKDNKK